MRSGWRRDVPRSSVTVTIGALSRPTFVSGLGKLVKDELHVSNPSTVISYGDGIAALAMGFSDAETEIKKAESDES